MKDDRGYTTSQAFACGMIVLATVSTLAFIALIAVFLTLAGVLPWH